MSDTDRKGVPSVSTLEVREWLFSYEDNYTKAAADDMRKNHYMEIDSFVTKAAYDQLSAELEKAKDIIRMYYGYCTDAHAPTPNRMAREFIPNIDGESSEARLAELELEQELEWEHETVKIDNERDALQSRLAQSEATLGEKAKEWAHTHALNADLMQWADRLSKLARVGSRAELDEAQAEFELWKKGRGC